VTRVKIPKDALRIDGRGKYLMPGLIDMHVHLKLPEYLLLYVANGVTTVRNMRGEPRHLEWRARVAKGEMLGPQIYTTGPILDGDPPFGKGGQIVRNSKEAEQAVAEHKQAGYDFIKVYNNLSKESYDAIIAAGKKYNIEVVGHVPLELGLEYALKSRQHSIEHAENFIYSYFHDDLDESKIPYVAKAVRDAGVWVCPTLVTFQYVVLQTEQGPDLTELLQRPELKYIAPSVRQSWLPENNEYLTRFEGNESRRKNAARRFRRQLEFLKLVVKGLHDAGARLVVGSDAAIPFVLPGFSVMEEIKLFVEVGYTPLEAIKAATRDAAECLNRLDEFGTIAVGKRADLILLSGNPLENIANLNNRAGVMVRGRWFTEGELQKRLNSLAESYRTP
jgi:cytosine/adenosine deaminase-related metal-dependent hydrolase